MLAATALLATVLTISAVLIPGYRAPDEPQHLSTALRLATGGGYPAPPNVPIDPAVLASQPIFGFTDRHDWQPEQVRPPGELPSMRALGAPGADRPPAYGDQMAQHPPAYYAVLAVAIRLLGLNDSTPPDMLLTLRLVSAALLLPVPLLCVRGALLLGLPPPGAAIAAFLPAAWVQFTHIGASLNNGTLLVLASSAALVMLLRLAGGDLRPRVALAAGCWLSVALLTKGFALPLVGTIALALLAATRVARAPDVLRAAAIASAATLPGMSWWITNQLRYGMLQPSGVTAPAPRLASEPQLPVWLDTFSAGISSSMWASFGWLETRLPDPAHLALTTGFAVALAAGSWRLRRHVAGVLMLHSTWVAPLALAAAGSAAGFLQTGNTGAAQGRYVQSGVVGLAILVAAALPLRRGARLIPLVALLTAAAGLLSAYRYFWSDQAGRWSALTSWWPAAELLIPLCAVIAVVATATGISSLAAIGRQADQGARACAGQGATVRPAALRPAALRQAALRPAARQPAVRQPEARQPEARQPEDPAAPALPGTGSAEDEGTAAGRARSG